jgi:ABC-2 type transport system permease protein
MIDGFRYGVTGEASADLFHSLAVLVLVNGALAFWAYRWLATGYRLKA